MQGSSAAYPESGNCRKRRIRLHCRSLPKKPRNLRSLNHNHSPNAHSQHNRAVSRKAKSAPISKSEMLGGTYRKCCRTNTNSSYNRIGPQNFATVKNQRRNSTRNRCFTIFSSFSFCVLPEQKGGTLARLSRCPGRKRFRFPARLAKRTRPALNRNQLADRSPQINIICK